MNLGLFLASLDMVSLLLVSPETGFQNNIPLTNCDLPGYNYAHTKGVKGGALLYVSDHLQYTERVDLDSIAYKDKELESKFIEIIQADDKNVIVGCILRCLWMNSTMII